MAGPWRGSRLDHGWGGQEGVSIYNRSGQQQAMIGLIIPPADIKKMLEKTAEHVAINGFDFERILVEREQHKSEFAFLKPDSPYRPYYDRRVSDISKKMMQGIPPEEPIVEEEEVKAELPSVVEEEQPVAVAVVEEEPEQAAFLEKIFVELKEPKPDKYAAELPEKLSEGEQAIIQHTAQYSAKNGKNFLMALSEREKNNPQFQFLRNSSKHHLYFLQLTEAYTHLLTLDHEQLAQLEKDVASREEILSRCKEVFEYHMSRQQQARGKKEQAKPLKESNVDWNDFELVDTITFDTESSNTASGGELLARIQRHAPMPQSTEEKIISEPKKREILQQCHVCRQNILVSEMNKHLKTCLGQKKKAPDNSQQQGQDVDIRKNLEGMSSRRPDIFGKQEDQIKAREEKEGPGGQGQGQYDGQAANMNRSTGSMAMLHFQQKKLKEEAEKKGK